MVISAQAVAAAEDVAESLPDKTVLHKAVSKNQSASLDENLFAGSAPDAYKPEDNKPEENKPEENKPEYFRIDAADQQIIACLQTGLPICSRPYLQLANDLGLTEQQVIQRLENMRSASNIIKRLGVIVRHHELGYQANAMVVWNIPDEKVAETGRCFSQYEFVTLCYQRPRSLPDWPYNLFSMIHGQDKTDVLQRIELMSKQCDSQFSHDILFSKRRFKQRGALHQVKAELCLPQRDKK